MYSVDFLGKNVSKLILGDNPINGYSYIEDTVPGREMKRYYTADRIIETLFHAEELGINTMLPLADPFIIRVLEQYRNDGGKMQFIFQPYMAIDQDVSIRQMAAVEPIGIYHQGTTTDNLFEAGKANEIRSMIEKYRVLGIPVGVGTHRPDVIEMCERENWNVDFYMACLQNARIKRQGASGGYIPAKTPDELIFYPEDRKVMLDCLKKIEKPVIAFKLFAGGQMFSGLTEKEKRERIMAVYHEVFDVLKPSDVGVIGVFQKDLDQLKENCELFERGYEQ